VIGLCTRLASDEQLRSLSFWTLGCAGRRRLGRVGGLAGLLLFALWRVRRLLQAMNALALGEAAAAARGWTWPGCGARSWLVALLAGSRWPGAA
jgi:iron complex transport system permease protein